MVVAIHPDKGRQTIKPPADGKDFGATWPVWSESNIGDVLDGLFSDILKITNPSLNVADDYQVTDTKENLPSLYAVLAPTIMGLMRAELDPINVTLVPVKVSHQTSQTSVIWKYSKQLPHPVAPMGTSRVISTTKESYTSHQIKEGLAILIDGHYLLQPEGQEYLARSLQHISGTFTKRMAFTTMSRLVNADPDRNANFSASAIGYSQFKAHLLERKFETGIFNKSGKGISSLLKKLKNKMTQLNEGIAPDACIIPPSKSVLFVNNPQMTDYKLAGDGGPDLFYGRTIIGSMHQINFHEMPLFPNSEDQGGQMINTRRLGNYVLVTKLADGHATINGIEVYDLNTDNFEYLGLDKLMQGIPFLEQVNMDKPKDRLHDFYFALITKAYACFKDEGLLPAVEEDRKRAGRGGVIPKESKATNPNPFITRFDAPSPLDVFSQEWHAFFYLYEYTQAMIRKAGQMTSIQPAIKRTFEALMAATNDTAGITYANLERDANQAPCLSVVRSADAAIAAPIFERARLVYLGHEVTDGKGVFNTPVKAIRFRLAMRLIDETGGAFTYLLRPVGVFSRNAAALGLTTHLQTSELLRVLAFGVVSDVAPKVYLFNLEAMLGGFKEMRKQAAKEESWYTHGDCDGKEVYGSVKAGVTIFTAQSYFDRDGDFLCIRPADTQKFARFILMTGGGAAAFGVMSPPYFSRGEDAGTQSFFINNTQYQGVHIADYRKIKVVPDSMYAGCVGGSNTRIFTWAESVAFRKSGFTIKAMEDASMYVIPIRRDSFHADSFLCIRGKPEIIGGEKFTEQYPFSLTWSALHHWDTCTSEYTWTDNRKKVLATVCFPTTYRYTNQSGVLVPKYGGTHHGPFGECNGAQEVRMLGERLYAREIQVD